MNDKQFREKIKAPIKYNWIKEITLDCRELSDDQLDKLVEPLKNNTKLKKIIFTSVNDKIAQVIKAIEDKKNIVIDLDLYEYEFSDKDAQALITILKTNAAIKTLDLSSIQLVQAQGGTLNPMERSKRDELRKAIYDNPNITCLNLNDCSLIKTQWDHIAQSYTSHQDYIIALIKKDQFNELFLLDQSYDNNFITLIETAKANKNLVRFHIPYDYHSNDSQLKSAAVTLMQKNTNLLELHCNPMYRGYVLNSPPVIGEAWDSNRKNAEHILDKLLAYPQKQANNPGKKFPALFVRLYEQLAAIKYLAAKDPAKYESIDIDAIYETLKLQAQELVAQQMPDDELVDRVRQRVKEHTKNAQERHTSNVKNAAALGASICALGALSIASLMLPYFIITKPKIHSFFAKLLGSHIAPHTNTISKIAAAIGLGAAGIGAYFTAKSFTGNKDIHSKQNASVSL